jgi:hypothetical protein
LFLITLPRTTKSKEIFRLTGLCYISRGIQSKKWAQPVLQLPAVRSRVGKLQATTSLFVVRGRAPAQRMPGERDGYFYSKLLQLQAAGR